MKNYSGFTTLEILIAVVVLIIVAVIILGAMRAFRDSSELDRTANDIMNIIREARSRTLSSENGNQFGARFESGKAVLFKGATYDPNDPNNEIYNLSSRVEISNINFSASTTIFKRLTGEADPAGDVSVRLKANPAQAKIIFINSTGLVYVQ